MPDMREISDRCRTDVCKGECCRFLTFNYDRSLDEDFISFLILHGIEVKQEWIRKGFQRVLRTYMKVPVQCQAFDSETFKCKIYDTRPRWCRINPTKESPFIDKNLCSVLTPQLLNFSAPQKPSLKTEKSPTEKKFEKEFGSENNEMPV
jgi:Fe-S-cluster containining protein